MDTRRRSGLETCRCACVPCRCPWTAEFVIVIVTIANPTTSTTATRTSASTPADVSVATSMSYPEDSVGYSSSVISLLCTIPSRPLWLLLYSIITTPHVNSSHHSILFTLFPPMLVFMFDLMKPVIFCSCASVLALAYQVSVCLTSRALRPSPHYSTATLTACSCCYYHYRYHYR